MIPKIIHYCWFGKGEMNELQKKCLETWERELYDYKIIQWNEESFDVESCQYTSEAYKAKKFAYVSDYVRLYALKNYGGIYLDTDVFVLKSFNSLLVLNSFIGLENEKEKIPATCVIGACENSPIISIFLKYYEGRSFFTEYGYYDLNPNTIVLKKILNDNKDIFNSDILTIFPEDYFSPKLVNDKAEVTSNTYSIHYFDGSWLKNKDSLELEWENVLNKYVKIFGKKLGYFLCRNIQRIKKMGFIKWIKYMKKKNK